MSGVLRIFGLYALVELAAVAGLVWAIGFGWTTLLLLGIFLAGLVLASGQIKHQIRRLRKPADPGVLADSGLVTAGSVLVLVPGPVTSLVGLLLLAPPTRAAARPLLAAMAATALGRHTPLVAAATVGRQWYTTRRTPGSRADFIDAEFVDVTEAGQRTLPVG
ncbi:FxsA family protein [Mycolicibacter icosiumassiliensis]|uniref:FxsA family protein n=1 Tax=Mycolicibacter icosiumassiliensis TaxID=1792835 RepID=UPI001F294930|nr:FxsA family protein [Mycolicibacter icosiumassiliensis]